MKTVQRKLQSIVEKMGIAYQYIPLERLEAEVLEKSSPVCIHIPPVVGVFTNMLAQYKDAPTTKICFIKHVDREVSTLEEEEVIQLMKEYAMQFIEFYNESGLFKPLVGEISYQVLSSDSEEISFAGVSIMLIPQEVSGINLSYS